MADDLSPLAAALRDADKSAVGGAMTYGDWERFATAAREHLSPAPPAAPTERPTCATCPYWEPPKVGRTRAEGLCRRFAPREEHAPMLPDEWCGDHPDFPAWIASRRATT